MNPPNIVCATALLFATSIANAAGDRPIKINFAELIKHPKKYNGKRIDVKAYVVTSCTHCGEFYASPQHARMPYRYQHSVAIGRLSPGCTMAKWPRNRLAKQGIPNDGFVHVVGTFHYNKPKTGWKEHTSDPNVDVERVYVGGFGWMGLDDKQITNITVYEPIGPEIPSGIN